MALRVLISITATTELMDYQGNEIAVLELTLCVNAFYTSDLRNEMYKVRIVSGGAAEVWLEMKGN